MLWRPYPMGNLCLELCRAGDFRGFGIDTPSVESVVDDLSHGGNVGVNVHPITCG